MKNYIHTLLRTLLLILAVTLPLYTSAPAHAQTCVFGGNAVISGNLLCPAPQSTPPPVGGLLFTLEQHSISDPNNYPTIPFGGYRQYGTSCQWNTMWTGGDTYNFACFLDQLNYAHSFNAALMFTFGQVPSGLSTINPDNTSTTPAQFPVTINGASITCSGGNCTATISTLQRLNACVTGCPSGSPDSVTLTGATTVGAGSCPENPNGTFTLTAANNPTDYPGWTYTFAIGPGSTSSGGCGGTTMTLADNAQTASRCSGTPAGPLQQGGCYAPNDLTVNGSGTDAHFISFLTQLLAYDAAHDPSHTLQYIEMWNEPQGAGFFNGSIAQMARMTKDAYNIIQASPQVSWIKLTSPAPSGGLTAPANYLGLYGADPTNPFQYVCCINNHTYNYPPGAGTPDPMAAITIGANVRAAIAPFPSAQLKPQLTTEGSWGFGPFGASSTNIGPNTGTAAGGDKAGWVADAYMAHLCAGYSMYSFFAWDQQCNTGLACATPPPPYSISPAGIAYGIIHDIMVGATVAQTCTKDGSNNWTLKLQRGSYNEMSLWNTTLTTLGTYTIPAGVYTQYRDVSGNITPISSTQTTVPVQFDPIFLETGNPPFFINSPSVYLGTVGVAFSGNVTAPPGGGLAPFTYKERTLPSTLASIGLSLNSTTGAITGTPSTVGNFHTQIGAKDANGLTYAKNITISIASGILPLNVTSGLCGGGTVGNPYSCSLTASGGKPPYTWSLISGSNPAGTSLTTTSNVGIVSGTPTTAATYTPVYRVADSTTPTPQTATTPVNNIVILPPLMTCGPPGYLCSSRSTAIVQNPSPLPFNALSPANTIAYDTSLNPAGLDPIVRVTDPNTFTQWSCDVTPSGGENDNLFNVGSTRIIFTCIKGSLSTTFVAMFDPTTMQVSSVTALPATLGFPYWSRSNPDILYTARLNGNLDQYTFNPGLTTYVQTTIFNTLSGCSGLSALVGGSSFASAAPLSGDLTDTFFHIITTSSGQQSPGWVIIYDKGTGKCSFLDSNTGNITLEDNSVAPAIHLTSSVCFPIGLHAGHLTRDGVYSRFSEAATTTCTNPNNTAWQVGTRNVVQCDNGAGGGSTCGPNHNSTGYAVEVVTPTITGQGGFPQTYHFKWSDVALPPPLGQYYGTLLAKRDDVHITTFGNGPNIDTNPILGETFYVLWDGSPFIYPGEFEIQAYLRTPLQTAPVVRFAHTFTSGQFLCPTCDFRDQNAIGAASQDGKFLMYVSDEGLTLGTDAAGNPRQDVFIIGLDYVSPTLPALSVNNAPCTGGVIGAPYSCTLTATGGVPPYTWTLNSGSNPAGTSLTNVTNTGVVSGTLTGSPATYTPVYKVTDSAAATALAPSSGTYTIVITAMGSAENLYCGTGNIANFGSDPGPTTLPQSCINTDRANTPSTGTVRVATNSSQLTTDLAASVCNDIVELLPGTVYTGNFTTPSTGACAANQWITIRTQNWLSAGPAEGVRVSPCWAGIFFLPGRPLFNCASTVNRMAQIITANTTAPLTLSAGANHIRIEGIEFTRSVGGTSTVSALISRTNCTVASPCSFIVLDQVWGHGTPNDETTRMMSWDDISFAAAVNGFYSDFHCASVVGTCTDSQTFSGGLNTGTTTPCFDHAWKHYNNYLESAGETFEYGGGGATTTPCDIEDRSNWMFKPLIWNPVDISYSPPTNGHPWVVKNHWESKNGTRALIEGNVIQNVWGGFSQVGAAVLWTPKSQAQSNLNIVDVAATTTVATITLSTVTQANTLSVGEAIAISGLTNTQFNGNWTVASINAPAKTFTFSGSFTTLGTTADVGTVTIAGLCPLCFDSNFTFRYNRITSSNQPFQIGNTLSSPCSSGCFAAGGNTYSVHDNVADNIGWADANNSSVPPWSGATDPVAPSNDYLHDLYMFHNTFVYPTVTAAGIWPNSMTTIDGPLGAVLTNIVTRDNIIASGQFGLTSIYSGTNRCAFGHSINTNGGGPTWLPACWGGASTFWDYNCIVGGNTNVSWIWPGTAGGHNVFPADYTGVSFTNYNSGFGGDYHLQPGSTCHNAASDGTDMGANVTMVNTFTTGVDQFGATLLSTVPLLTGANTPTCTGVGTPDAGCSSAFVALSTAGGNTNAQTQVIDPLPGNMSLLPTRSYLYPGATTKTREYYQPFFPCGSHVNIGMDEANPATVAAQAAMMVAMGIDINNLDYYGNHSSHACEKSIADAWAAYLTANPSVPVKFEIMLDQGAIFPFCTDTLTVWSNVTNYTTGQGVTFSGHAYVALNNNTNKQPDTNPANWQIMETCILNAMKAQLDTIDSLYGSHSFYSLDASGRPFLFLFITPANWANTDFAGTIYPSFLTYAHTHYVGRVYQVLDRFGAFGPNFDGEYAWIQPPPYVNATPQSQLGWDDITGGPSCVWSTGVCAGVSYLNTFYAACHANATKHCIGMLSKGFDWTPASWMTGPKIIQQGCGNLPWMMAAKISSNGFSSSVQLEGLGWVTGNDYEEGTGMEMGIDNCARPSASITAPNQLGWLENPTDVTYFSENSIDHWEIWFANTGSPNVTQVLTGIAPSVSTEILTTLIPTGTHDVYLYMVGKSGIMNRLAGPVSYTH